MMMMMIRIQHSSRVHFVKRCEMEVEDTQGNVNIFITWDFNMLNEAQSKYEKNFLFLSSSYLIFVACINANLYVCLKSLQIASDFFYLMDVTLRKYDLCSVYEKDSMCDNCENEHKSLSANTIWWIIFKIIFNNIKFTSCQFCLPSSEI